MKLPQFYADSTAFSEDFVAFTEIWLKPETLTLKFYYFNTYRTDRSSRRDAVC